MRTNHFVSMLICLFIFANCRQPNQDQTLIDTLEVDGSERSYQIHLPSNFDRDTPAPLLLALHGGGGKGSGFDQGTDGTLIAAAAERGLVLVLPEGLNRQWCDGRTVHLDAESDCTRTSDVAFISELIDKMIAEYGIDPARVYVTGISNGGFMSVRLALELSEKITAVAPVTAQLSAALENQVPQLPVSIMVVNGTEDPIVPYDGGHVRLFSFGPSRGEVLSTATTVDHFSRLNGCDPSPEVVQLTDSDPEDGTQVEIESYLNCDKDTEVILVRVIGAGHTWPSGQQYLSQELVGRVSREINASEMILDFFLDHVRESTSKP